MLWAVALGPTTPIERLYFRRNRICPLVQERGCQSAPQAGFASPGAKKRKSVAGFRMRRLHLFEFGDQPWFPRILREAETAYLVAAYRLLPLARDWAERILNTLHPGDRMEILDLCSGAGGAIPRLIEEFDRRGCRVSTTLTDLYPPSKTAEHPRISWIREPLDATRVPPGLAGVRTMFSAFHHFRPAAARAILEDAFRNRRSICIFESGSGTLLGCATMLLVPLNVLAMMPFARPFRWPYLLFTYLIPLLPLIVFWDGIVSMLRIYSPEQMKALTQGLGAPDYVWEMGRMVVRGIPGGLPYLIGRTTL